MSKDIVEDSIDFFLEPICHFVITQNPDRRTIELYAIRTPECLDAMRRMADGLKECEMGVETFTTNPGFMIIETLFFKAEDVETAIIDKIVELGFCIRVQEKNGTRFFPPTNPRK